MSQASVRSIGDRIENFHQGRSRHFSQADIDAPSIECIRFTGYPAPLPKNSNRTSRGCGWHIGRAGKTGDRNITASTFGDVEVQQHVPGGIGTQVKSDMPADEVAIGNQIEACFDPAFMSPAVVAPLHLITGDMWRNDQLGRKAESKLQRA